MNGVAWINLARGVLNAVKIWVDPEYEEERDLIIRDFDRAYVKANYPDDYAKYFAALESK